MNYNSQDSKLKTKPVEVDEKSIEAKLYQIIDDIDTASDIYKSNYEGFAKYCQKKIKEAHQYIHSPDGFRLVYTISNNPPVFPNPIIIQEGIEPNILKEE